MSAIWKYPLRVDDTQSIEMPTDAKVLCVQIQRGLPCMWAMHQNAAIRSERIILTIGTGHEVDRGGLRYIGTYQLQNGNLMFHVFEKESRKHTQQ